MRGETQGQECPQFVKVLKFLHDIGLPYIYFKNEYSFDCVASLLNIRKTNIVLLIPKINCCYDEKEDMYNVKIFIGGERYCKCDANDLPRILMRILPRNVLCNAIEGLRKYI